MRLCHLFYMQEKPILKRTKNTIETKFSKYGRDVINIEMWFNQNAESIWIWPGSYPRFFSYQFVIFGPHHKVQWRCWFQWRCSFQRRYCFHTGKESKWVIFIIMMATLFNTTLLFYEIQSILLWLSPLMMPFLVIQTVFYNLFYSSFFSD